MLPKINRLPGYKIPLVLASRKAFHSPLFTLKVKSSNTKESQVGFIVSKKTAKKAVDRNRIKRLTRESFRKHQTQLRGLDVVVLVRRGIMQMDNAAVFRALDKHWNLLSKKCESLFSS